MGQEWIAETGEPLEQPIPEKPIPDRPIPDKPIPEKIEERRPIDAFRKGAVGGVLAAGMLGLRDALEGPREEEVAIVETVSGDPPRRERIVLRLDPDEPSDSIVMIRD